WTPREKWSERDIVTFAAQKSLRALGVGTEKHISQHYIHGRYPQLRERLNELERAGEIERLEIRDSTREHWKGMWYIHRSDIPLLEKLERGEFQGRTVLLSPFDNLVRDRVRNLQFWNFDYKIEIYVPQAKRKYGYYVLPILRNDQLIGRIDPKMDRAEGVLNINAVYLEPAAPHERRKFNTRKKCRTRGAVCCDDRTNFFRRNILRKNKTCHTQHPPATGWGICNYHRRRMCTHAQNEQWAILFPRRWH
ncbi:MAG: hypothetical protein B6D41_08115, partial [Chloroflexi bacterium UTCFX4]